MSTVEKLAQAIEKPFEDISEDVVKAKNKYNLNAATSYELDMISNFFGSINRGDLTDEELITLIKETIAIQGSVGTIDMLLNIIGLLTNATTIIIHNKKYGVFNVELEGDDINMDTLDSIYLLPAAGCGIDQLSVVYPETFRHDQAGRGLDQGEMI